MGPALVKSDLREEMQMDAQPSAYEYVICVAVYGPSQEM